jgi:hypothetical protein
LIPHVNQGGLRTQGNPRIRDWVCRSTNSGSSICPSQSSFTQGRYNEVEHTASLVARPRSPLRRGDRPLLGVLIIRYSPRSVAPRRTRCFGPSSPHPARVSRTLVAGTTRPRQAPRSIGPEPSPTYRPGRSSRRSVRPRIKPAAVSTGRYCVALRCVALLAPDSPCGTCPRRLRARARARSADQLTRPRSSRRGIELRSLGPDTSLQPRDTAL